LQVKTTHNNHKHYKQQANYIYIYIYKQNNTKH